MSGALKRFADRMGLKISYIELGAVDAPSTWSTRQTVYGYKVKIQRGRKSITFPYYMGEGLKDERPDHNVLDCIFLDAMTYKDSKDINAFADDMGYSMDTPADRRRVKKIYKGCEGALKDLEHLFTDEEINDLAESI